MNEENGYITGIDMDGWLVCDRVMQFCRVSIHRDDIDEPWRGHIKAIDLGDLINRDHLPVCSFIHGRRVSDGKQTFLQCLQGLRIVGYDLMTGDADIVIDSLDVTLIPVKGRSAVRGERSCKGDSSQ